jgi:hypothetical protein
MNEITSKLLAWVTQSLAPAELLGSDLTTAAIENWKNSFNSESAAWRFDISSYLLGTANDSEKKQYLRAQQNQLTILSNKLNHYLCRDQKIWSGHSLSKMIKNLYSRSLVICEDLLEFTKKEFPEYADPYLKITDFRLSQIFPVLRTWIYQLKLRLLQTTIDPILIQLVIKGMSGMLSPSKLTEYGYKYLIRLTDEISELPIIDADQLKDLLIQRNFNFPEFYMYLSNGVNARRVYIDGLHEEYEYILQEREILSNKVTAADQGLFPHQLPLKAELQQFLNEKAAYLEALLAHRRQAIQDKFEAEQAFRMLIDIPVPVFALFVRMLKETRFILKTGITDLCTFFALHFYTDKAAFISSANLLKRSTDVEFATVLKLWDLLNAMLDWLDFKFNVRSMKRSAR